MVVVVTIVVAFTREVSSVVLSTFFSVIFPSDEQQISSCFEKELNSSGKPEQGTTGSVSLQRDVWSQQKYAFASSLMLRVSNSKMLRVLIIIEMPISLNKPQPVPKSQPEFSFSVQF